MHDWRRFIKVSFCTLIHISDERSHWFLIDAWINRWIDIWSYIVDIKWLTIGVVYWLRKGNRFMYYPILLGLKWCIMSDWSNIVINIICIVILQRWSTIISMVKWLINILNFLSEVIGRMIRWLINILNLLNDAIIDWVIDWMRPLSMWILLLLIEWIVWLLEWKDLFSIWWVTLEMWKWLRLTDPLKLMRMDDYRSIHAITLSDLLILVLTLSSICIYELVGFFSSGEFQSNLTSRFLKFRSIFQRIPFYL